MMNRTLRTYACELLRQSRYGKARPPEQTGDGPCELGWFGISPRGYYSGALREPWRARRNYSPGCQPLRFCGGRMVVRAMD